MFFVSIYIKTKNIKRSLLVSILEYVLYITGAYNSLNIFDNIIDALVVFVYYLGIGFVLIIVINVIVFKKSDKFRST